MVALHPAEANAKQAPTSSDLTALREVAAIREEAMVAGGPHPHPSPNSSPHPHPSPSPNAHPSPHPHPSPSPSPSPNPSPHDGRMVAGVPAYALDAMLAAKGEESSGAPKLPSVLHDFEAAADGAEGCEVSGTQPPRTG